MSIYGIKLSVFAVVAILAAVVLGRKAFFTDTGKRVAIFWLAVLPFVFVLRNELLNVFVFTLFLFMLGRRSSKALVLMFFIAVLGAVPDWWVYTVSAPGINYLIKLTYYKVLVIVALLPIFITVMSHPSYRSKWSLTDTLVCVFVLYMVVMTFRDGKITTVVRFLADSTIIYIIPYFVFTRVLKTTNDLHYCSMGFLMLSILIVALFLVSQLVRIDIYTELNPYSTTHYLREYRLGFLRLSGPFNGVLVGYLMLAGYLALDVLKRQNVVRGIPSWGFLGVCILCVFFGGSRGALFGFILGVGIYFFFVKLAGTKRTLIVVLMSVLFVLEFVFELSSFLSYEDEYGTFDYRAELYRASWEYLKTYPLFGSPDYLASGYFDHLVTGLGIIDIVSAYLQVALQYGYLGACLFVGIFLSVLIPLCRYLYKVNDFQSDFSKYVVMYCSLNIVMMFVLSTTSMISLFPAFIIINLAVGNVLATSQQLKNIY